ncbi:MAG: galactokinase [Clostridia bacterium]|nr:galactokinase [Clostridia bacterium]
MNASEIKLVNAPLLPLSALRAALADGRLDAVLEALGGKGGAAAQRARCLALCDTFAETYGADRDAALFTVSGRSELSGNHTDHNHGRVVACSISLDMLGIAAPRADGVIRLSSAGFGEDVVDTAAYTKPDDSKKGTSASLIAGVCAGFKKEGYAVGGFDACVVSDVLKGSGLSSSAAFEDMVGTILSHLYNDGKVDEVSVAMISQYAENVFFGKPCGLMDQVACAVGGIVAIDFKDPSKPVITPIPFDMTAAGYHLCIVDTGGNHADLTDDYASVPVEMKAVAAAFGKEVLRDVDMADFANALPTLRERFGDRAVLRAMHFFMENDRVLRQSEALMDACSAADAAAREEALSRFFDGVVSSGRSSFCYLQNVYTTKNVAEQGLSLALSICENLLSDKLAAFRVHGGGFAGTIQAWVYANAVDDFVSAMDTVFGRGAAVDLRVRPVGAARIL